MGGLDILVNNAGGLVRHYGPFAEQDAHAMRQLVDLNLMGTLYATHAALDEMLPRRRGRVVTISSEGAKTSMTGVAIYNACKSAVVGFTGNLARELRGTGVTTVAVCPGPMIAASDLGHFGSRSGGWIASLEQIWDRLLADRFSFPEEVANMVAFLAGDAGAYVQGTAVSVGGGLSD
jgi:NAD(P)-dependent dehydrogenase (short-subunit alcohol dehydrogenase family)